MTDQDPELRFAKGRVHELIARLERLAAGDVDAGLEFSRLHDELDAIAFGINVLADELRWAHDRIRETERREAEALHEEALKRSDARFASAFHSNPCAMTVVRVADGIFLDVNASFERQTGYTRAETLGRTVREIGLWIDPDDLAVITADLRSGGHVGGREVRFRRKDGTRMMTVYSADVIMFGADQCVLAAGLDVTDLMNTERQAAWLRDELAHRGRVTMVEALTGSLAHEINQPLTAVMANADAALRLLMQTPPELADARDALADIASDTARAGDVVRRMRALLRKRETEYEPVEVNSSVTEVVALVRGNAVSRRIALDLDLAARIEPVSADRIQIQQVVLNLLLNAFDAVQDRDGTDRRVGLRTTQRDHTAVIEVRDYGAGLSDEALSRIFEPFFTTKHDGMGLGLSICRAIVGAHGGQLDAMRNDGSGMTFAATFPLWGGMSATAGARTARVRRAQ